MIKKVVLSKRAQKDLIRLPRYISVHLKEWIENVDFYGLEEVRKIPGYHDEPLHGWRSGQRSIRLNRSYRAIYIICSDNSVKFVSIEEVSKHDY
jgi:proteic killer suppression protein